MAEDKREPKQRTPKGLEIPVPKRKDFERLVKKVAGRPSTSPRSTLLFLIPPVTAVLWLAWSYTRTSRPPSRRTYPRSWHPPQPTERHKTRSIPIRRDDLLVGL